MTLTELLERVEKATGPDRELDVMIADAFGAIIPFVNANDWMRRVGDQMIDIGPANIHGATSTDRYIPRVTASIDAALALVERVLPGAWYLMSKGRLTDAEPLFACELFDPSSDTQLEIAEGQSQPLAIVAALLRALIAQEGEKP